MSMVREITHHPRGPKANAPVARWPGRLALTRGRANGFSAKPDVSARAAPALAGANAPAARFVDEGYACGVIPWQQGELRCYFNWNEEPLTIALPMGSRDFWSDEPMPAGAHTLAGYAGQVIWHPQTA